MISFILTVIFALTLSPVLNQAFFLHMVLNPDSDTENITLPYSLGPKLTSESALVVDIESDEILFAKNPTAVLPIASITKLMTALVFLENRNRPWNELVVIEPGDLIIESESPFTTVPIEKDESIVKLEPAGLNIRAGESLTVQNIFYGGLIKSANNAMKILARLTDTCCGKTFIDLMNEKAKELGMENTNFIDPTGLNPKNYSTTHDLVKLVIEAIKKNEIKQALGSRAYNIEIIGVNNQKRYQRIYSTNKLLDSFINLISAKTGYLQESGYCFAGLSNYQGRQLAVIVLKAQTDKDRFQEVKSLVWWTSSL